MALRSVKWQWDWFIIAVWLAQTAESAAMLRHIAEFVVAVLRQWGVLATGGFVVALIGVYEHWSGRPIAGRHFWIAIILSLVVAFFSVWRKERFTVEALNASRSQKERRKEVRDHLSRLLKEKDKLVKMVEDPYPRVTVREIDQWEDETCKYLRENLSEADENLFMDETGVPPAPEYRWDEPRVEQLERLHSRAYQLRRILDRLSLLNE
jgi:hypothetical protein